MKAHGNSLKEREVDANANAREASTLIGFSRWVNPRVDAMVAGWPGRRVCAIDWEDVKATQQLQRLADAGVEHILSERLPDEIPDLPSALCTYFCAHWVWLPPCIRIPDQLAQGTLQSKVLYLATGDDDFRSTSEPRDVDRNRGWPDFAIALGVTEGVRPVALSDLDFASEAAQSWFGSRGWVCGPASPQCAMALPLVAHAAGVPVHLHRCARVSPLRMLVTPGLPSPAELVPAKKASLRALLTPAFEFLKDEQHPSEDTAGAVSRHIIAGWSTGAFLEATAALVAGRDPSPFAQLPWHPVTLHATASASRTIRADGADALLAARQQPGLQEQTAAHFDSLLASAIVALKLPLTKCTPTSDLAERIVRAASAGETSDEGIASALRPLLSNAAEHAVAPNADGVDAGMGWTAWIQTVLARLSPPARLLLCDIEITLLARQGNVERSAELATAAYAQSPVHRDLFAIVGWEVSRAGAHGDAAAWFERDHSAARLNPWRHAQWAAVLVRAGRDAEAIAMIRAAHAATPRRMNLACTIAAELAAQGEHARARAFFAIDFENHRISPEWMPAFAECLGRLHDWDGFLYLVRQYFSESGKPTAIVAWNIEREYPLPVSLDGAEPAPSERERDAILSALEIEALRLPTATRTLALLGHAFERAGRKAEAEQTLARALALGDELPVKSAWFALHGRRESWSVIEDFFRERLETWSPGAVGQIIWGGVRSMWAEFLASTAIREGDLQIYEAAERWLQLEIDAGKAAPASAWLVAIFRLGANRPLDAVAWLDEHGHTSPRGAGAPLDLAYLLWSKGHAQLARDVVSRCAATALEDPDNRALIAGLWAVLGDHASSLVHYRKLRDATPDLFVQSGAIGPFNRRIVLALALRCFGDEARASAAIASATAIGGDPFLTQRLRFVEAVSPTLPRATVGSVPDFALGPKRG